MLWNAAYPSVLGERLLEVAVLDARAEARDVQVVARVVILSLLRSTANAKSRSKQRHVVSTLSKAVERDDARLTVRGPRGAGPGPSPS